MASGDGFECGLEIGVGLDAVQLADLDKRRDAGPKFCRPRHCRRTARFCGQWRCARKPSLGTDCICCLQPTFGRALACGRRLVLTALSCRSCGTRLTAASSPVQAWWFNRERGRMFVPCDCSKYELSRKSSHSLLSFFSLRHFVGLSQPCFQPIRNMLSNFYVSHPGR
jgi:hypothetical protein